MTKENIWRLKEGIKRRACLFHPRSIYWNYHLRYKAEEPLITKIDTELKVRIWPFDVIGKWLYINGEFERKEINFIKSKLKPGMTFFDVGANIGIYSLIAAKRVQSYGQVHSFEPNPRMVDEFNFNIKLNKLSNITLSNVALGEKTGTAQMTQYDKGKEVYGSLSSRQFPGADIIGHYEVKVETLDNYCMKHEIKKVDIMKIDVEGAELMVLKGAQSFLKICDPDAIILELAEVNSSGFGYKCDDVLNLLRECGYKVYLPKYDGSLKIIDYNPSEYPGSPSFFAIK